MSNRLDRVNEVIKEEVSQILLKELDLKEGVLVTVTRVETSRTLEHSSIWISIYPETESEKTLKQMNRQIYDIQQALNKRLHMKPIPKITFKIDDSNTSVEEVDKILKKLYN